MTGKLWADFSLRGSLQMGDLEWRKLKILLSERWVDWTGVGEYLVNLGQILGGQLLTIYWKTYWWVSEREELSLTPGFWVWANGQVCLYTPVNFIFQMCHIWKCLAIVFPWPWLITTYLKNYTSEGTSAYHTSCSSLTGSECFLEPSYTVLVITSAQSYRSLREGLQPHTCWAEQALDQGPTLESDVQLPWYTPCQLLGLSFRDLSKD